MTSTTCTPHYTKPDLGQVPLLSHEQQLDVVTQLMAYPPRKLLFDIHEAANAEIFSILLSVESWLQTRLTPPSLPPNNAPPPAAKRKGGGAPPVQPHQVTMEMLELEMDTGLHAMETLLTEQMDKACELFMSWSYRNVFTVGAFGGVVLPAHRGLDFLRGRYIAEQLPEGERSLEASIESLRARVEQKRHLKILLLSATKHSSHSLKHAKSVNADLEFFRRSLQKRSVSYLPDSLSSLTTSLTSLHSTLTSLPSSLTTPSYQKPSPTTPPTAWNLGRSAYIDWVEERAASAAASGGKTRLGGDERGGLEGVERILDSVGRGLVEDF